MDRPAFESRAMRFAPAAVARAERATTSACRTAAARPWRCHACDMLLGMECDGELHVKYKEAHYWTAAIAAIAATGVAAAEP